MTSHMQALEARMLRLERTNRILLALAGMLAIGVITGWSPGGVVEELRAERVQIVDAEGRVRMDLRHDAEETGMFIVDEDGDTRLGAAHFAHGGGGYALHGPGGKGAAVLYFSGSEGSLTMYDTGGTATSRFPEAGR